MNTLRDISKTIQLTYKVQSKSTATEKELLSLILAKKTLIKCTLITKCLACCYCYVHALWEGLQQKTVRNI